MSKQKSLNQILKPKSISQIIGQTHLLEKDGLILKMIEKKQCFSLIFYGPPGIGKTSLAISIANDLKIPYSIFNPAINSKEELIKIINLAKLSNDYLIIIDEAHRMNKDKQDILLPLIEQDVVHVFLTTTENPFFSIVPAIRSRCQIIPLYPISYLEMVEGIKKIIKDHHLNIRINDDLIKQIALFCNGDLRVLINIFQILIDLYSDENNEISQDVLNHVLLTSQQKGYVDGDEIHDLKSALQKSIRGSDVDASLYYLGRLIKIGDYEIIFRRLLIIAYEDINLANPNLCMRVSNAIESARITGFPEARYILSAIVTEMALSEKSNRTSLAIDAILNDLDHGQVYNVPNHLRDNHYKSAYKLGVKGYVYPHDYPYDYVKQNYLPDELKDKKYYVYNQYNQIEPKLNKQHADFIEKSLKEQAQRKK